MCQGRESVWLDERIKDQVLRKDDSCKGNTKYVDDWGWKEARKKDQRWRKEKVKTLTAFPCRRLWKIANVWKRTLESQGSSF